MIKVPLPNGTLTDEEFTHVAIKLIQAWGGNRKPCVSCGDEKYFIHPALIGNASDRVAVMGPHTRMPTIMLYCQNCGLAEQYVAKVLGIEVLQVGKSDAK